MHRCAVEVTSRTNLGKGEALAAPDVLARLGLLGSRIRTIRFGTRRAPVRLRTVAKQPSGQFILSAPLAAQLGLVGSLRLTLVTTPEGDLVLGPLLGLLISRHKLDAVLRGEMDPTYARYSRFARETGAVLFFFTAPDLDTAAGTVQGWVLDTSGRWEAHTFPLPRIIYDRCFGEQGRTEAARVRELAGPLGITVVNRPVKITKLDAFTALDGDPEVAPHLPYTVPFTLECLQEALPHFPDLYLKPNALYKGKGVLRLTRQDEGWLLHGQNEQPEYLAGREAIARVLTPLQDHHEYVLQEGLDLATYLGNRFDFRSLVQKNPRGRWIVSGLVARIAPVGGTITSPRSGGQVAEAQHALQSAFPDRWQAVLRNLEATSILLAEKVDARLGPCVELGLDVGVLRDGTVKLIEVNGKPLRVSLQRLKDPLVSERIHRYPIHTAAALDLAGEVKP